MYYLYTADNDIEIGPFKADNREHAVKVIRKNLTSFLGREWAFELIEDLKKNPNQLEKLTKRQITNIKNNYSNLTFN